MMLINLFSGSLTYSIHCVYLCAQSLQLCLTLGSKDCLAARQALLSTGFSGQGHWSGLLLYPPNDSVYQRESIQKVSPVLLLMGVWLFPFFSRCFGECVSLGQTPRVELLGHGDYACSALVDSVRPHSQAAEPGVSGSSASRDTNSRPLCQTLGAFCFDGYAGVCCCLIQAEYLGPPHRVFISHLDILLW